MHKNENARDPDIGLDPPPWWSLAGLVEDAAAHLGPESLHHFQHALAVARALPAELADRVYFEDRGERSGRPMDFIIGVGDAGRRILAGRNPALSLAPSLTRRPVWAGIGKLARRRSVASDPFNVIERILFEFDAPARTGTTPEPCLPGVFVQLPVSEPAVSIAPVTLSALECVTGRALPKEVRRTFLDLTRHMPDDAVLPFAAAFPSRDGDAIRVCLSGVRSRQLTGLLPALGASASLDVLTTLDACWPGRAELGPAFVHLDLGRSIRPVIGLEYHFNRIAQRSGRIAEWPFLERLEAMGLLSRDILDRCACWPGRTRTTLRHRLSPSVLVRLTTHAKIVWRAGHPVRAKAYLGAGHTPIS